MEKLLSLLEKGCVSGFNPEVPRVISTGSSHVFIFPKNEKALKLYRRDNEYWNTHFTDMAEGEPRRSFINLDYEWNHFYNPEVYKSLWKAEIISDEVCFSNPGNSDELIIEMTIVDSGSFLMDILTASEDISDEGFFDIGRQIAIITKSNHLKESTNKNFYSIIHEREADLMVWVKNLNVPTEFVASVESYLKKYIESNKESFESLTNDDFVNVIDCHSANAIYKEGKVSFVDVLLPKPLWRTSRVQENFFRTGVDIYVLRGRSAYEAYLKGFQSITPFANTTENFDLIYCGTLMLCIQTAYSNKDTKHKPLADKYYEFVRSKLPL